MGGRGEGRTGGRGRRRRDENDQHGYEEDRYDLGGREDESMLVSYASEFEIEKTGASDKEGMSVSFRWVYPSVSRSVPPSRPLL